MHHNITLRFAIGLIGLLIACSLAFAWAVNQREQRFAAGAAAERMVYSQSAAAAAYEKRCSACHVPEQTANWVARRPASTREGDVFEFLQQHGRASEVENRMIARLLAENASGS